MPAFDGGDDFVGIGGPDEGLWLLVGLVKEAADGGPQIADDLVAEKAGEDEDDFVAQIGDGPLQEDESTKAQRDNQEQIGVAVCDGISASFGPISAASASSFCSVAAASAAIAAASADSASRAAVPAF